MLNKPEYTRFLPHYHPVGATFFVTTRLHGSLPQSFLDTLSDWYTSEKERIAALPPIPNDSKPWNFSNATISGNSTVPSINASAAQPS